MPALGPSRAEYEVFQAFILDTLGLALGDDKAYLLYGRLQRRMAELGLNNYGQYYRRLSSDRSGVELQLFCNAITTTKTDFYREKEHFELLKNEIYPALKRKIKQSSIRKLRLWSAGCSMGQEVYSMAFEAVDIFEQELEAGLDMKFLGTDINTEMLAVARSGTYNSEMLQTLSAAQQEKYFCKTEKAADSPLRVNDRIADLVEFRRVNFMQSTYPIETTFQVIFCRNVFYYFDPGVRQIILNRLAGYLDDGGWLVLSVTEIGYDIPDLVKVRGNIFRRQAVTA
jgi:chemotaxis protein methyltransferase CheR|tara:strand:- start:500 stop:1351 length:852 start_codon:yes stop_codon:yes gene_type:complete